MAIRYRKKKKNEVLTKPNEINVLVNDAFEDIIHDWNYETYLLIGGYGSSKSHHGFTKVILKCLEEPGRTVMVVRKTYASMKNSCFSLINKILKSSGINSYCTTKKSPFEFIFDNGSRIFLAGIDDPESMKSVDDVSIVIVEEADQISYEVYNELLGRIRNKEKSNHFILMTNPVSKNSWIYSHFFQREIEKEDGTVEKKIILDDEILYTEKTVIKKDTYYHHSTVDDNYHVPRKYIDRLDALKETDPDRWRVGRLGQFGTMGKRVLPQFSVDTEKNVLQVIEECKKRGKLRYFVGGDAGFVTSYNCLVRVAVDTEKQYLYIIKEHYIRDVVDTQYIPMIQEWKKWHIIMDCADPKLIRYMRMNGFNVSPCKKGQGSVINNIRKIKRFNKIICMDTCRNAIKELQDLTFKTDKDGHVVEDTFTIDSHFMDAIAYALNHYEVVDIKTLMQGQVTRSQLGI